LSLAYEKYIFVLKRGLTKVSENKGEYYSSLHKLGMLLLAKEINAANKMLNSVRYRSLGRSAALLLRAG